MLLLGLALAGTRSDQLSALSVVLEEQVEAARSEPGLAAALALHRLAMLDPEGALEAASWAPDHAGAQQAAMRARQMLDPAREGVWFQSSNRFCIDLLQGGSIDQAFVRCSHADLEARLLLGFEREEWATVRSGLVRGLGERILGQVQALQVQAHGVRVLHRVELVPARIEGELAICPDGCSDLQVGLAWNGLTDTDRAALTGRALWAVTDLDFDDADGQILDVRVQGVSLLEVLDEPLRRELVEDALTADAAATADAAGGDEGLPRGRGTPRRARPGSGSRSSPPWSAWSRWSPWPRPLAVVAEPPSPGPLRWAFFRLAIVIGWQGGRRPHR